MLLNLLNDHIGEIITGVAGLGAWFYERKKRTNELKQQETQTHQSVVDLYQEALDDLKKRYDGKFADLEVEIKQLRTNLNLWKTKYATLKTEFEQYRLKHDSNNSKI